MPFLLARGEPNLTCEVQRWQYFLHKHGIAEVGALDGDFGQATERATAIFQRSKLLPETGKLDEPTIVVATEAGYIVVADDHYDRLTFPTRPTGLRSPDHDLRTQELGCYVFSQPDRAHRGDMDGILIHGTCDGSSDDWERGNIVRVVIPELVGHPAGPKSPPRFHKRAAISVQKLFAAWSVADLLHLIISWDGSYVARYKRTKEGSPPEGHGNKLSKDVPGLSNHAYGTAFDINASQNPFMKSPAPIGGKGCVAELVTLANQQGFFWGGHFSKGSVDGMHFELARMQ